VDPPVTKTTRKEEEETPSQESTKENISNPKEIPKKEVKPLSGTEINLRIKEISETIV